MKPVSKQAVLAHLLGQGSVYLHLDATRPNVQVPESYKNDILLTLVVGLDLALPIPDLDLDSDGVTATLSFSQTPFHCFLPWPAIFAMSTEDGTHLIWPADAPRHISLGGLDLTTAREIQADSDIEQMRDRSNDGADAQSPIVILSPNAESDTALQKVLAPIAEAQAKESNRTSNGEGNPSTRSPTRAAFSVLEGGRHTTDDADDIEAKNEATARSADTNKRSTPGRDTAKLRLVK